ncbi:MAG: hypothetical protein IKA87_05485 [Lentisphaeria bacterium]|nr:hypothetical protein [Lentisphaeria bacterium]
MDPQEHNEAVSGTVLSEIKQKYPEFISTCDKNAIFLQIRLDGMIFPGYIIGQLY